MKIPQLIVAAGITAASLVGLGGVADAAPTAGTAVCVTADAPAQIESTDASVSMLAPCDVTACAEGALATVTDDSGVQQQACVASAAADPGPASPAAPEALAPVAPARSSLSQAVPTTGPAQLPRTGAGTGGLVIAALLVASGSVASLLSRRKPARRKPPT